MTDISARRGAQLLFGAEEAVASVAQPGKYIAVLVKAAIERSGDDRNVGKHAGNLRNALRCCDKAHEFDRTRRELLEPQNCRHGGVAGGEHRVDQNYVALREIVGQLQIVFDRLQGSRVAVDPDMADPCRGQQVEHPIEDAVAITLATSGRAVLASGPYLVSI